MGEGRITGGIALRNGEPSVKSARFTLPQPLMTLQLQWLPVMCAFISSCAHGNTQPRHKMLTAALQNALECLCSHFPPMFTTFTISHAADRDMMLAAQALIMKCEHSQSRNSSVIF